MKDILNIETFDIIEDEENYYFFRALNMEDNKDIETEKIIDETGSIKKIRTDRERYEENPKNTPPKYNESSKISLEQVYDHIKIRYRKDTNCISLSSNANVSVCYGRGFYKDTYILVKVPKKEFGEKVINAGQYMLEEIERKVNKYISLTKLDKKIVDKLTDIDNTQTLENLKSVLEKRYTLKKALDVNKAKLRKDITYKSPDERISKSQALNEEQLLEKNKIISKLTVLEEMGNMPPIIPHTTTNKSLIQTIGSAFSSLELIHYGDIPKESIITIPKEIVDILSLLQQIEGQDQQDIKDLKREVIKFVSDNKIAGLPEDSNLLRNNVVKENITIEEMYELTQGRLEYGIAKSIIQKIFYLAKSQTNAKELAKILYKIVDNNPKYSKLIQYISDNGFVIEPQIMTRKNGKGVKLSESVNIDLKLKQIELINKIKALTQEEQIQIIENGGLSNVKDIMSSTFSKVQADEKISKEEYYVESIISLYDWKKIGIKKLTLLQKNDLIQRLKNEYCVDLYKKLEKQKIDIENIPTILLNIITKQKDFEITQQDTTETIKQKRLNQYDKMIKEDLADLNQELSIEKMEEFLGYHIEDINTIDEFIKKLETLRDIGVDVSKIIEKDTIKDLIKGLGISDEELKQKGLNPNDKIGIQRSNIVRAYRRKGKGIPPTEEQEKKMRNLGVNLDERDSIEEFIDKLEKLRDIGVDISNIHNNSTIKDLVKGLGISDEELKQKGLNPDDNIGGQKSNLIQKCRGNERGKLPEKEQIKKLKELGINFDKRDSIKEFIEKLKKLNNIGADISKTNKKTIIRDLVKNLGISDEELKNIGLNPDDKIGSQISDIIQAHRGNTKRIPPKKDQVEEMENLGINFKKQEIIKELEKQKQAAENKNREAKKENDEAKRLYGEYLSELEKKEGRANDNK